MYEKFGAIVKDNRVEFILFFPDKVVNKNQYDRGGIPNIDKIWIRGDFQGKIGGKDWELESAPEMKKGPHEKGYLWTCKIDKAIPEGFYQYKYYVKFKDKNADFNPRWCSDPCTKYGGGIFENSAFVIGGETTTVKPITKRLPQQDLIIYEMMIDNFTKEFRGDKAPIDAVLDKLDYLEGLGINAIEFMPWTAWPGGEFSWGYDPFQFFAVEYRYVHDPKKPCNKLFKLKTLINKLHERNIHVIMDGVFNHVKAGSTPINGFPYHWLYQNPKDSPYIGAFEGGGFFEELDYDNQCTQEFIRDVCYYWLDQYEIDGIRFDYTRGYYQEEHPKRGIIKLLNDVKDHLSRKRKKNVALILEHLTDNRFDAIQDTNQTSATGCWFDPFMFNSINYAFSGNIDMEILRILNANMDFASGKGPVTYIENHDHSTVVSCSGGRWRWYKTQAPAIALLTSPGTVLIHNGQEFGEDYSLEKDRLKPRPLKWKEHSSDFVGNRLYSIYKKLIEIRKDHPSLRSANFFPYPFNHEDGYGSFPDKDVVVYHRYGSGHNGGFERFIVVVNYSDFDQYINIPFSTNGQWEELLSGENIFVENYRLFNQKINSNWGRIYYQSF